MHLFVIFQVSKPTTFVRQAPQVVNCSHPIIYEPASRLSLRTLYEQHITYIKCYDKRERKTSALLYHSEIA